VVTEHKRIEFSPNEKHAPSRKRLKLFKKEIDEGRSTNLVLKI
jgi:hypothetical protein